MLDVKPKDAQLSTREYENKMKLFMKKQFALLISDGQTEVAASLRSESHGQGIGVSL